MQNVHQAISRLEVLIQDHSEGVALINNKTAIQVIGQRINQLVTELAQKDAEIAELKKDDPKS